MIVQTLLLVPLKLNKHSRHYKSWKAVHTYGKDITPYVPPDIENVVQLLQYLRLHTEATSNSVFILWVEQINFPPYWGVSKESSSSIQTFRPSNIIRLIERNIVHLIDISSNEFLAQHALGTLKKGSIKISVNPDPDVNRVQDLADSSRKEVE